MVPTDYIINTAELQYPLQLSETFIFPFLAPHIRKINCVFISLSGGSADCMQGRPKVNIWWGLVLATSWLNRKLLRPGLKSRQLHHQCNPEVDTDVIGASLRTDALTTRMP